jgi:glycosyltransferase involved in cell wall biosynthesis
MTPTTSLIVAVYNKVWYLEYIFAALERQTSRDFEVIVADDGSGPDIRSLVERTAAHASFPIHHVWQPDDGFRKNEILNKAIKVSTTDYLIFIDGDCVPHHDFIRDHLQHREENTLLSGRRVNFSRPITERLTLDDVRTGRIESWSLRLLLDGLFARSSNLEEAIRIEHPLVRRILHRNKPRILGCNFSVEKLQLERINGFNEEYQAPGLGEDSDVAFRLGLIGTKLVTLKYLAVLYHLYHPTTRVGSHNQEIYTRVLAQREPICRFGLHTLEEPSVR